MTAPRDERLLDMVAEALIQARGALRLDAMVGEDGKHYGTTEVALAAIQEALDAIAAARGERVE